MTHVREDPVAETVEALVARDVPRAGSEEGAGPVRRTLLARSFESSTDVAVVDGDRVLGVVSIEALLAADLSIAAYFTIAVAIL